ncbi:MAG: hypothetical protein KC713_08080, partial [Candidatus Omnitrophica bacterium]|nr:hypothetical protein [Candidatus Omnitrophota bacterium]
KQNANSNVEYVLFFFFLSGDISVTDISERFLPSGLMKSILSKAGFEYKTGIVDTTEFQPDKALVKIDEKNYLTLAQWSTVDPNLDPVSPFSFDLLLGDNYFDNAVFSLRQRDGYGVFFNPNGKAPTEKNNPFQLTDNDRGISGMAYQGNRHFVLYASPEVLMGLILKYEKTKFALSAPDGDDITLEFLPDMAVTSNNNPKKFQQGGIDFNPDMSILSVQKEGNGFVMPAIPEGVIEQYRNIPGFTPTIIGISAPQPLPMILGLKEETKPVSEHLASKI